MVNNSPLKKNVLNENHSKVQNQIDLANTEIAKLLESEEFLDFVSSISESLDDGVTFNELLSSNIVLKKALAILRKSQKENK
ncbi:MAG: hypothetical protein FK734_08745 [Asgard group archaeon]|nr:hypothetical protein [Asgard group archaeon]